MRVIGGEFRSRALKSAPGVDVRPTPDRLREALFNVLAPRIEGVVFADLYAGTGAVGIEALSRGASRAIFVEQHRAAVNVLRQNLKSLEIEARAQVLQGRATALLDGVRADIVFLDPPYAQAREYETALAKLGERPPQLVPSLVIAQHDVRLKLAASYGALCQTRVLRQGDNCLSFYAPTADAGQPGNCGT
jgi:16S rRNA (guanine966-N2)-methyltransferase